MKVEIKGNDVIITLPLLKDLPPSSTMKSLLLANSGGRQLTNTMYKGSNVTVNAFASIPNPKRPKDTKRSSKMAFAEE